MTTIFGVFGPQSFVVLIVALIGVFPVVLFRAKTPRWFLYPYVFLFVAAFATNFEDVLLPDLLNLAEHTLGNLAAGVAFAVAAYVYRRENIAETAADSEA